MNVKRDPSLLLQMGFMALLIVSLAQAGYWIYERITHTNEVRDVVKTLYENDAAAVTVLLTQSDTSKLAELMPHLVITGSRALVSSEALQELDLEARNRKNQFLWEGGFFIAVLLGGLLVLTRAIRHDAELRWRQQNFLAAVSHEFKSPLASIRLAAETLLLRSKEDESRRLGQRILEDNERLLRMTENLLDTTKLEEGKARFEPEKLGLAALAKAASAEVAERTEHAGIRVGIDVDEQLEVSADRTALESILRNLLDNAVNACLAGNGQHIELAAARADGRIELTVSDDGAGFPADEAEMIFEKFYRAGDELTRTTPGTGLGLFIVRRLAESAGARISAHSDGPGKGARFTLSWPEAQ